MKMGVFSFFLLGYSRIPYVPEYTVIDPLCLKDFFDSLKKIHLVLTYFSAISLVNDSNCFQFKLLKDWNCGATLKK